MPTTLLYNILVILGIFVGQYFAPGNSGALFGAAAGMVAATWLDEQFGAVRRSADGFFLRHRGEFLAAIAGMVCLLGAPTKLPKWPTWLAMAGGWMLGYTVGSWLAEAIGWSGRRHADELEARAAYLAILASAANADGDVSAKQRATIAAAAKRVMSDMGYGDACDVDQAIANANVHPCGPIEAAAFASQLAPPVQQALLLDLLSILYTGCRGGIGPSEPNERWLDTFRQSAQLTNWLLLGAFDRRYADGGRIGSRAQWLSELGLSDGATEDEIRAAYRRKAAEYHPDRHQGLQPQIRALAEAKLTAITEAYRRLIERAGPDSVAGPLFIQDAETGAAFVASRGGARTCRCWLCQRKNRLPPEAERTSARCGDCYALLAITSPPDDAIATGANTQNASVN